MSAMPNQRRRLGLVWLSFTVLLGKAVNKLITHARAIKSHTPRPGQ